MLPDCLSHIKDYRPQHLVEVMRAYKGLQKGHRVTASTTGGGNSSWGIKLPNSNRTERVGENSRGNYLRTSSSVRDLGGFNQTQRRTTYTKEPTDPQAVGKLSGGSTRVNNFRSTNSSFRSRIRPSKSHTANMIKKMVDGTVKRTPNIIKRLASKAFNSI